MKESIHYKYKANPADLQKEFFDLTNRLDIAFIEERDCSKMTPWLSKEVEILEIWSEFSAPRMLPFLQETDLEDMNPVAKSVFAEAIKQAKLKRAVDSSPI